MREIVLSQGFVAFVDDDMYEELNQHKWHANKNRNTYYARRHVIGDPDKKIKMHHEVMGKPPKGYQTDHKNGNGLWNLKSNLRFVTNRQNNQNRTHQNSSSRYPGVGWAKREKRWRARITIDGEEKGLGYFKTEIEAFSAYKKAVEAIDETVLI